MKGSYYDSEADIINLQLQEGEYDHSVPLDENIIIDLDKNKNVLGIEILFAKKRNPAILKYLPIKKIVPA